MLCVLFFFISCFFSFFSSQLLCYCYCYFFLCVLCMCVLIFFSVFFLFSCFLRLSCRIIIIFSHCYMVVCFFCLVSHVLSFRYHRRRCVSGSPTVLREPRRRLGTLFHQDQSESYIYIPFNPSLLFLCREKVRKATVEGIGDDNNKRNCVCILSLCMYFLSVF